MRTAAVVAVLYFVADTVLNKFALGDGWQIFWPLNGVTIALLITRPRRAWPLMLGAITVGTGIGEYIDNNPFGSMLIQRALSVLEVLLSAWLLPQLTSLDAWLRKPGLYPRFAAAVFTGPVVSGLLAAAYFHEFAGRSYFAAFNSWALADAMGIAAALPLFLALRSPEARTLFRANHLALTVGTLITASAVMIVIFTISQYPLIFVLYPLLMLVDRLLGFSGSSIALFCACILAVFLTEHGYGPFANPAGLGMSRNLAVQLYLGFHLIGFLPISILFLERRWMDQELRESLALAAALASVDDLTGVANRRALDKQLDEQWRQAARRQVPLALLMIDADHFKQYNDQFGHQEGDACLRAIAATLAGHASRPGDLVARFGGEEFVILLPDTPLEGARSRGEAIRAAIFELAMPHPGTEPGRVTISVGCAALIPRATDSCQRLVELADQTLYLAKRAGRNRVHVAEAGADIWRPGTAARKLGARIAAFKRQHP